MAEVLSFTELVTFMLQASGSCADISWEFMTLSMREWTRVIFVAFTLVSLLGLARAWNTGKQV
jgi:disulfide bond formation protein DsbB